jgi:hypothetical protein
VRTARTAVVTAAPCPESGIRWYYHMNTASALVSREFTPCTRDTPQYFPDMGVDIGKGPLLNFIRTRTVPHLKFITVYAQHHRPYMYGACLPCAQTVTLEPRPNPSNHTAMATGCANKALGSRWLVGASLTVREESRNIDPSPCQTAHSLHMRSGLAELRLWREPPFLSPVLCQLR